MERKERMTRKLIIVYSLLLICLIFSGCTRTTSPAQEPAYPTLQLSHGRIVFISTRDNGGGTVYVVNSDGTGLTRVTPPELVTGSARWAPGCGKIAFSTNDGIYVVNPDGSGLRRILDIHDFGFGFFSWSPDGSQIAFNMTDEALPRGDNIWIVNSDGSKKRQFTYCSISCFRPIWHPGGESVFYFSDKNDYTSSPIRTTLNRTDIRGTMHETWLSTTEMADIPVGGMRSISPDGTRFVLVKQMDEEEHTDIFVLDIESKEWQRLTNDQAYHDEPAWSPDGQQIVFVSYHIPRVKTTRQFPTVAGLWIMNTDGAGRIQIVGPEGRNLDPDWCMR